MSEGPEENLIKMDIAMKKVFSLKTEILGGGPSDVRCVKVLNRQISWKDGEILWEADPRHVEILSRQLGLENCKTVATPGDKNDLDKTFRYRDLDGEGDENIDSAQYVDSLCAKGASPGRVPASLLMRKENPKLATGHQWADLDDDGSLDVPVMEASTESSRRAEMAADGWSEGNDHLWRKHVESAEWMPTCDVSGIDVTHSIVRDGLTGVLIYDSAGACTNSGRSLSELNKAHRAFRRPRSVDICVEVNLAEVESDPKATMTWEETPLCPREASEYRAASARLNYLALDRPDILYASKECSRRMSSPRNGDWAALKRVVRYLVGRPRLVWRFVWQEPPKFLSVFSDSNWAGCHDTRKSTSGASIMHGSHLVKAYSRTQSNIALSSGEAEFYALVSGSSEALGVVAMTEDFGDKLDAFMYADASAAIGVAGREGLGRIRHLDTQSLWLQQALRKKRLGLGKVLGTENPSDLMTKHVDAKTLDHHVRIMGCSIVSGRPELAPQVVQGIDEVEAVYAELVGADVAEDRSPTTARAKPLRTYRGESIEEELFVSSKLLGRYCKGHDFAGMGRNVEVARGSRASADRGCEFGRPRSRGSQRMSKFGMAASTPMHTSLAFSPLNRIGRGEVLISPSHFDDRSARHVRTCAFSMSNNTIVAHYVQQHIFP